MNFVRLILLLLLVALGCAFASNTPTKPKDEAHRMMQDVAAMFTKKFPSQSAVRSTADRIAKKYPAQFKDVAARIKWVAQSAKKQLANTLWQDKLNLAMEIWRIHSSLDLLRLVSPEVLESITGLKVPELLKLGGDFSHIEAKIEEAIPMVKRCTPTPVP